MNSRPLLLAAIFSGIAALAALGAVGFPRFHQRPDVVNIEAPISGLRGRYAYATPTADIAKAQP